MSLLCSETGEYIEFGTVLMAGKRPDLEYSHALSEEALRDIPESEKRSTPCQRGDGGVDIHEAFSTRNFNGAYTWSGFKSGAFRFSISAETAKRYLPRHLAHYSSDPKLTMTLLATALH